jgi:hypothetical protein
MFGGLASAHHSIAGYDTKKEIVVRGTVVEFRWRNPHIIIIWNSKDESGNMVEWSGEMASTTTMMQLGMTRNSLKKGDEAIFSINRSATGQPLGLVKKITGADGHIIVDRVDSRN